MNDNYDAIVIGAGSAGVPVALFLSLEKLKVLVIDAEASVGQGQNKAAIGGVRATHSDPAKIKLCLDSQRIFDTWSETWGHDIGWKKGGYCFPAFREREETVLKGLLAVQQSFGLDIQWVDAKEIEKIVPGITPDGLRGGTFSPGDGQVSPLLAINAMYEVSRDHGCEYRFGEPVTGISTGGGAVHGVSTAKGAYSAPVVVNAAGGRARQVGALCGLDIPVTPDSHEAGISAPVEQFLGPLVVDLRPGPEGKTANFYFAQNHEGAILFCYTPSKLFIGENREPTSEFLPILAKRMIGLVPRLKNILVRRIWRGLYPMTPDNLPVCGRVDGLDGYIIAAGMCGHGFMMGPGVGRSIASLIVRGEPCIDPALFATYTYHRDFYKGRSEALK
jgi:sarcosine oxidase subunit beta